MTELTTILVVALAALVAAMIACWQLSRPDSPLSVMDQPNDRSMHSLPVPRTGGLGIMLGIIAGLFAMLFLFDTAGSWAILLACASPVALAAFVDDCIDLSALTRLGAQTAGGVLVILAGFMLPAFDLPGISMAWPGFVAVPFTLLFIVWMTNLYNFMDGLDGLAGGMALFGFAALAVFGLRGDEMLFAVAAASVSAAGLGFLVFNFPPARIFMGDVGSSILGFLAAGMILWGVQLGLFSLPVGGLVFVPFVADSTITLLRRLVRGEKIWRPHREHYFQRLALSGWSHRAVTLSWYGAMAACAVIAHLVMDTSAWLQWSGLLLAIGGIGFALMKIESRYRRRVILRAIDRAGKTAEGETRGRHDDVARSNAA